MTNPVQDRVSRDDQPKPRRRELLVAVVLVVLLGVGLWVGLSQRGGHQPRPAPGTSAAPSAPPPPAQPGTRPVDLSGWKLTIPEESDKGHAALVDPAEVTAPWLTRNPDGSLTFWAPAEGATTAHSQHPRTELDSLNSFTAATSGPRTLTASLVVSQVPQDSQDIILGQIHGADDIISVPYVMLHYKAGTVRVVVKQQQKGSEAQNYQLLTGVPLNQRFDFTLTDNGDGTMAFTASSAGNTQRATAPVPEAFHDQSVRFQVGDYQQAEHAQGNQDGGRVTFYEITQSGSGS